MAGSFSDSRRRAIVHPMRLADLLAQLPTLPHDLGRPIRGWTGTGEAWSDPTWRHLLDHAVGGLLWWVGALLLTHAFAVGVGAPHLWFPWLCAFAATFREAQRQELGAELKGVREFPLWAMVWDVGTTLVATGLGAFVLGRFGS